MDSKGSATAVAGIAALSLMAAGAWWILQSRAENGGNGVCTPGNTQQMQCADGSVIIFQQCQDGQWVPTGLSCPGGPPPPQEPIILVGKVVDIADMRSIIGATVRLVGRTYGAPYIAHSNSRGEYRIENIQSDHYDVTISALGFLNRYHYNLDLTIPHPYLDAYDLTEGGNALILRMPVLIDLQYPNIVNFEGGHWCCGALSMKSRHPKITVTATVWDNGTPSQPMPEIGVIFHPNSTYEGCFFCSTDDKKGYGNLSVPTDHNGQAICYYYCKNEKNMQRFFEATIDWFWSVKGGIDVTPPLKADGIIVTQTGAWFPEKTCYGECEKEFKGGTSVGCVP